MGLLTPFSCRRAFADDGATIRCVKGNTNEAGGSNGYCVAERFRKKATNDYGLI